VAASSDLADLALIEHDAARLLVTLDSEHAALPADVAAAIERAYASTGGKVLEPPTRHPNGLWRALLAQAPDGPLVIVEVSVRREVPGT
jgi:hypothetical protein